MASYARRDFAGAAPATTLSSDITASSTTISVADGTGYPTGSGGNFFIVVDRGLSTEEKILCSSRSGNTFTVVATTGRGADETSASAHSSGAAVEHPGTKTDFDEANYAVNQTVGQVSAKGSLLAGTGANALDELTAGADDTVPMWDSSTPTGLKAASPASAGTVTEVTLGASAAGSSDTFARGDHVHRGIPETLAAAKGDLIVATAFDALTVLPVGANSKVLEADSTAATGLRWGDDPVRKSLVDAQGDMLTATAADTVTRHPLGNTGEVWTVAPLSADGMGWLAPPAARVRRTTAQTVVDSTPTAVSFDAARLDNLEQHDTVIQPTRLTCQLAGVYVVSATVDWAISAAGTRVLWIDHSTAGRIATTDGPAGASSFSQSVTTIWKMAVGEYLRMVVYQTSGGPLDVNSLSAYSPEFSWTWVGPG